MLIENTSITVKIKVNITKKIEEKSLKEGKKIYIRNIVQATGITQPTLYRMINQSGNTWIKHIVTLCDYFQCGLDELVEYEVIRSPKIGEDV